MGYVQVQSLAVYHADSCPCWKTQVPHLHLQGKNAPVTFTHYLINVGTQFEVFGYCLWCKKKIK